MAGELGLKNTFKARCFLPYWNYRNGGRDAGTIISFEEFIQTRPDGGEKLKNAAGGPLTLDDIFHEMGKDRKYTYLMDIVSRGDDFQFAFGPVLEDPILKGFLETPDEQPAMWKRLCAGPTVPTANETVTRPYMRFDGRPVRTGEGEDFPKASVRHSKELLAWGKMGLTIELTEEFIMANPMPIVEQYLNEIGRVCQAEQDKRIIATLISGDLPTGATACPMIGVANIESGIEYIDFNRVWTRGSKIKERWFTILAGEDISNKIGMMDEFKRREQGQPLIVLMNRPEPREMERYVTDEVPDHQAVFVDTSHAIRHRSFIPPMIEQGLRPQNWTRGITYGWSDTFERMADRAVVGVDETLLFSERGFPDWFVIGGARQWAA